MVPAYTAAAFIKKFARLALTAPPAGRSLPAMHPVTLWLVVTVIDIRQMSGWHLKNKLYSQSIVVELGG